MSIFQVGWSPKIMTNKTTVLALKYRPQVFDDLIGQEIIAETIYNSIKHNKSANAYLFTGIRGIGKTTIARIVAKSLNCLKGIKPNLKNIDTHLNNSLMLVTALNKSIGYDNAAKIAKNALKKNTKLKYEAIKTGLINEKEYDKIVNPIKMTGPN